jgi:hypothetical protein
VSGFALPAAHAAWLTRAAAPDNLAVYAQYIAQFGVVEEPILDCFRHGGGLPYSAYPRFHEIMAEDSGQTVLPVLLEKILPLAPGLSASARPGAATSWTSAAAAVGRCSCWRAPTRGAGSPATT